MSTFPSYQDVESWVIPQLGEFADEFDIEEIVFAVRRRVDSYEELEDIPQDELDAIFQAHDVSARG